MKKLLFIFFAVSCFGLLVYAAPVQTPQIPVVNLSFNTPDKPAQLVKSLNILLVLTLLVLAPSLVLIMTSFTRLIIVFSFLRQAIGTQQMPPTQILVSLAMVLTFFIMEPVGKKSYDDGIKPYMEERIGYDEAFDKSLKPFKDFMIRNTREKDLAVFLRIRHMENPKNVEAIPMTIVIPAFMISEIKTSFEIGFLLFLPFLVVDMVVSSVLMSMGMMMLPPVMVSLPMKLLLFILVDGWSLLTQNLVLSFK
jgi:flagellar biosynthesis protein FliP